MTKKSTATFLLSATERELLTMPTAVIAQEVIDHFVDLYKEINLSEDEPSDKTRKLLEQRMCHCGILFAEGRRLMKTHPDLGYKLILASCFWGEHRGLHFMEPQHRKALFAHLKKLKQQWKEEQEAKDEKEGKR